MWQDWARVWLTLGTLGAFGLFWWLGRRLAMEARHE